LMLRSHPDAIAIAALVVYLLVAPAIEARPRMELTLASAKRGGQTLEQKGQRVWQRLEERLRRYEDRFERVAPPARARDGFNEVDSE